MSQTRVELLAASVDLHNELSLNHGSNTRLRIHTDGKIGVGTATPSTLFTVKNTTASATGAILVQNASYAASQDFPILIAGTSSWTGVDTNWGTFGFQFKLKSDASSVARIAIETSNSGTVVEGVSIEETGYVGLNVTNPTEQLDINGNIAITGTVDGRDVSVDGAKLDGIAAGAEVNVDTDISHTVNTSFIALNSSTGSGTNIAVASTTDAGFMSAADKTKLVGIAPGAEVNVQSDWNATSGDALILNKPTIPTNNNQLTNGAGYITSADGGDAATLDGIDSANFLRSDQEDQAAVINIAGEISPTSSAKFQVYGFSRMGPIMIAAGTAGATSFNTNNERWIMNDGSHLYASTASNGYNNKIWTDGNDGSGSGLDADKLDNLQATSFLRSDATTEYDANGNNFRFESDGSRTLIDFRYNGTAIWQLKQVSSGADLNLERASGSGNFEVNGSKVWYAGNDGSGSGLDADTLDGIQASSFLRSDASDTFTSLSGTSLTIGNGVVLSESADRADLLQISSSTSGWGGLQIRNSAGEGRWSFMVNGSNAGIYDDENNKWHIYFTENSYTQLRHNGSVCFETTGASSATIGGNTVWHAGNDGSGSGLDADTVDGIQASSFLRSDATDTATGNLTISRAKPVLKLHDTQGSSGYYPTLRFTTSNNQGVKLEHNVFDGELPLAGYALILTGDDDNTQFPSTGALTFVVHGEIYAGATSTSSTNKVWHAGNDGAGSGLDADTVDGLTPSNFIRADTNDNVSGHTEWQDNYEIRLGNSADFRMWHNGTDHYFRDYKHANGNIYWQGEDLEGTNTALVYMFTGVSRTYVSLYENSGERLRTTANGVNVYGSLLATGDVTAYSDERLKKNIRPIENALDKVKKLNGVKFEWKETGEKSIGVIAQNVEKVLPEVVKETERQILSEEIDPKTETPYVIGSESVKHVAYGNMVGVLIEAVKELTARVEELEEELKAR